MKYKVGDKVKIKSRKEIENLIEITDSMLEKCGTVMTIKSCLLSCNSYLLSEDHPKNFLWSDEMIEGLVEEETKPLTYEETVEIIEAMQGIGDSWECPQGYQFVDENGNVINAMKIVLKKKKKEYPKTYEECCADLGLKVCPKVKVSIGDTLTYRGLIVETFIKLLACRDTYLKRYEIEMKLNSRWTPDYEDLNTTKFCITTSRDKVIKVESSVQNYVLAFPTEEMRDAFYENFKEEIEKCKELL